MENNSPTQDKISTSSVRSDPGSEINETDWDNREVGESYPDSKTYHCDVCNDAHFDTIDALQAHIKTAHDILWGEYLKTSNLHRCAGCGESLSTLGELYCTDCEPHQDDKIPCRNCGETYVKVANPFCSSACATERITATDGPPKPLAPPTNPTDVWLDHPHRMKTGIPSSAPYLSSHTHVCRECYEYGSDGIHEFAVHVSKKHEDMSWGEYIEKYAMRRCRVCDEPLSSLLPLYCSDMCQRSDSDPVRECKRDGCTAAVERRQEYCSMDCYREHRRS